MILIVKNKALYELWMRSVLWLILRIIVKQTGAPSHFQHLRLSWNRAQKLILTIYDNFTMLLWNYLLFSYSIAAIPIKWDVNFSLAVECGRKSLASIPISMY